MGATSRAFAVLSVHQPWQNHHQGGGAKRPSGAWVPALLPPSLRVLVATRYSPRCWRESREHWSLGRS